MKYPVCIEIKNRKYNLIKKYKHFGLYVDEMGFRRCYDLFDIKKELERGTYEEVVS